MSGFTLSVYFKQDRDGTWAAYIRGGWRQLWRLQPTKFSGYNSRAALRGALDRAAAQYNGKRIGQ